MRRLLFVLALLLLNSAVAMQISEIMYDPVGSDTGHEWIEIYNNESAAVNLTGWKFFEGGINHGITLINGSVVLDSGAYAIIADNSNTFLLDYPNFSQTLFDSSFTNELLNTGEYLVLKDSSSAVVENITYDSSWGANGDNNSLQIATNGSWCAGAPTPGLANACADQPQPQEDKFDLQLEVKIQNATKGTQAKDLFRLTNLNPKTGQYVNVTVNFNAKLNGNLEYSSSFTVQFVETKATSTGTWTPAHAGTYTLCGNITTASFADPDASNNAACANVVVSESQAQIDNTTDNETAAENKTGPFSISILEIPKEAKQGENFTAKIELKNNFNDSKSIDVYSYVYSGSTLATEGGWTGNLQTLNLTTGKSAVVNLTNKVKSDAILGNYSFKVRAVVDSKKYDAIAKIEVLENTNLGNLSTSESPKTQASSANSDHTALTNNSAGVFVWNSKSTPNIAILLFVGVLLIFVVVLLLMLLRKQNP